MANKKIIPSVIILGPTASGKSSLAVRLAEHFNTDVIHADSRQIYKGMNIGTAKPDESELARVNHHLLGIVTPDTVFSAEDFCKKAANIIKNLHKAEKLPVIEGGTGFYIRALTEGLFEAPSSDVSYRNKLQEMKSDGVNLFNQLEDVDPEAAKRIHPNDTFRIIRALEVFHITKVPISKLQARATKPLLPLSPIFIGFSWPREILYERINLRVEQMIKNGLLDEVRSLLEAGYTRDMASMRTIGYAQICEYLSGETDFDNALEKIKRESRRYAKRQMTWFRKKQDILWLDPLDKNYFTKAVEAAKNVFS